MSILQSTVRNLTLSALVVFGLSHNILHAAACCTSATSFGTGRLLLWESFAAGIRTQAIHERGFFLDDGSYEPNEFDQVDQRLRIDAYSLIGLSDNASLFLVVPWLLPRVGFADDVAIGSNVSDVQIGYRHQVIAIGEYEELPSLALLGSVIFPTGSPKQIGTKAHEITGRDALTFIFGASLEKTWLPFFAQLNLGSSLFLDNARTKGLNASRFSTAYELAFASGIEITPELVSSLMLQWTHESDRKYKLNSGLSISWRFNPHITLQANVGSDLLLSGIGANLPGSMSYGMGIRYGYF